VAVGDVCVPVPAPWEEPPPIIAGGGTAAVVVPDAAADVEAPADELDDEAPAPVGGAADRLTCS
jgi:hypothetical protein